MNQGRRSFRNPFDIETPPGAEGWESMYPSYLQFGEELRERDEQKLWFFDQMHNPEPLYPFDLMMPESWLVVPQPVHDPGLESAHGARHRAPHRQRLPVPEPQRHRRPGGHGRTRARLRRAGPALLRELGRDLRPVGGQGHRLHRTAEGHPVRAAAGSRADRDRAARPRHDHRVRPAGHLQPLSREHARDGLLPLRDAQSRVRGLPHVPGVLPQPLPGHHRRPGGADGRGHRRHPLPARRRTAPARRARRRAGRRRAR